MSIKSELDKTQRDMERDAAQNTQPFGNRKVGLPPHMSDKSMGGGYVDTGSAQRARDAAAQTDKNLNSAPQPRKP